MGIQVTVAPLLTEHNTDVLRTGPAITAQSTTEHHLKYPAQL